MAPEQCGDSHEVTERADIYALGATLCKLLCGHAPYSGPSYRTALQKLRAVGNEPIPPLQTRGVNIPDELARIVHRALEFDPQNRFATAAEFGDALAPFTTGSDLVSLCAETEQADRESGDAELDSIQQTGGLISPSISAENRLLAQNSDKVLAQQSEPVALPQKSSVWWRAMVATAVLALFALAGIVIYLETGKGTLTIESAADDVEITIRKADRVYEKLQLKQGANSLRVGAGKYEIEITSESDSLEIEDGVFTLKRGDDWIARVSEKPPAADVARMQPRVAETRVSDPTFEGKTFQEWLEQYRTERSINVQMDALKALKNLCDTEDQTREVIRAIYQSDRPADIGSYVVNLSNWPRKIVIEETKRVLASGSSDDQKLAMRTLEYISMRADLPPKDRTEFLQSIEKLTASTDADVQIAAIQFLVRQPEFSDSFAKRLSELLKDENRTVAVEAATALVFVKSESPGLPERLVELVKTAEAASQGGKAFNAASEMAKSLHGLMVLGQSAAPVKDQLIAMLSSNDQKYLQICQDYRLSGERAFGVERQRSPLDPWGLSRGFGFENSDSLTVRDFVVMALGEIGPQAAAALPILEEEWKSYSNGKTFVRVDQGRYPIREKRGLVYTDIAHHIIIQAIARIKGVNWREMMDEQIKRQGREPQEHLENGQGKTDEKELPIYDGQSLTYWLAHIKFGPLQTDSNPSLIAIQALRDDESSQPYLEGAIAAWLKSAKRERNPDKLGWAARVICLLAGKKLSASAIDAVYEIATNLPLAPLEDDEPSNRFFVDANQALDQVDDQLLNERFVKELQSGDSTSRAFTLHMLHPQLIGASGGQRR